MKEFALGIDFGSNSVRALIIDADNGAEYGTASFIYSGGNDGIFTVPDNPHLARQNPEAYLETMENCVKSALKEASAKPDFNVKSIIGIGIDATASTPLPVTEDLRPLSSLPEFHDNLNAYAWMWKDHTAIEEAAQITAAARAERPEYLEKCGGSYSAEWFWSKLWHCLNNDKKVFDAAYTWLDFPDFIPAVLGGIKHISQVKAGICAAGHKSLYCEEWGGLPDADFLKSLAPELAALRPRLYQKAYPADTVAANLCPEWAKKLGLPTGIPIAAGIIDAHSGAVGAGVGKGRMVKIIGTSSCDILAEPAHGKIPDIPGICGIVNGSVLPGCLGIEAGQAAVGDILNWFVSKVCASDHKLFKTLHDEAVKLRPGQSGLLALDWQNGNRNILCDQQLTGLIIGMTLHTSQAEIFRALIEATAFGAKKILDRLEQYGIVINEVICCGGIAEKDALFMQIYADILGRQLLLSASAQTCALGAAIFGIVVAGKYSSTEAAQEKICQFKDKVYQPNPENRKRYAELYELYSELHDSFGVAGKSFDHAALMKRLLKLSRG
ncbi:MAG: ribulokinase [Victivallaceae bacterium]